MAFLGYEQSIRTYQYEYLRVCVLSCRDWIASVEIKYRSEIVEICSAIHEIQPLRRLMLSKQLVSDQARLNVYVYGILIFYMYNILYTCNQIDCVQEMCRRLHTFTFTHCCCVDT